jgi:hypothetical protein
MGTFEDFFKIEDGIYQGLFDKLKDKLKDTTDLTGIYKALFDYIIDNANGTLKDYIENPDLQYLEKDNGTGALVPSNLQTPKKNSSERDDSVPSPNFSGDASMSRESQLQNDIGSPDARIPSTLAKTSITYKLSNAGVKAFKNRIIEEKKRVYKKWKGQDYKEDDNEDAINKAIENLKDGIKLNGTDVKVVDYIENVKKLLNIKTKDKIIDWLFGSKVTHEIQKKPKTTIEIKGLQYLSERIEIVKLFVDYCRSESVKNPRQSNNMERAKEISKFLKDKFKINLIRGLGEVGNKLFYTALKEFLKKKLEEKNDTENDKIKDLLRESYITHSNQEKVMRPALREYKNGIEYTSGIWELDRALGKEFNDTMEVITIKALLVDLLREAQKIVQKLPLTFKNQPNGYNRLKKLQLFVLEEVATLKKQRSFRRFDDDSPVTDDIELNRPLVNIENKTIQFINEAGNVFFILDRDNPNMAYNVKKKNGGTKKYVNIDFKARKIGDNAPEDFYKTLRASISNSISGRVDWQALYEIDNSGNVTTHLIWRTSGGGGHGIGRADNVENHQYFWAYRGPEEYSKLGEKIGLEGKRKIKETDVTKFDDTLQAKFKYKEEGVGNEEVKINYSMIQKGDETYIQVNTPYTLNFTKREPDNSDVKTDLGSDEIKQILKIFHFKYYRRINADKVIKNEITKKNRGPAKNRPRKEDVQTDSDDIPLNPPICFQSGENYRHFRAFKGKRGVIKNKGEKLFTSKGLRKDAGTTMKGIKDYAGNVKDKLSGNRLPATKLAQVIIDKENSIALEDWQNLKGTEASDLPTAQEWCHLRGHGDGGKELLGNFVSGSFHCNTEQLAIEMGQRRTTQAGKESDYMLKSTAYLLQDDSMESKDYEKYKAMYGNLHSENKKGEKKSSIDNPEEIKKNAPVASFIRYKVYRKTEIVGRGGRKEQITTKIFDYTFEGQSEFFDKNQYKILSYTVRFLLAGMVEFDKWYKDGKKASKLDEEKSIRSKSSSPRKSQSPIRRFSQSPSQENIKKRKPSKSISRSPKRQKGPGKP